jgi:hypothetical protein
VLQHICATLDPNSEFGPRLTIESGLSRYSDFHSLGVRMADHPLRTTLDGSAVIRQQAALLAIGKR